jgi:hypothetical protein
VEKEPGSSFGNSLIDCRYVGTVMEPPSYTHKWSRYKCGDVRLGNEGGRPDTNAGVLLGIAEDYREQEDDMEDSSEEISKDGGDGWISSSSEGPRRPRGLW